MGCFVLCVFVCLLSFSFMYNVKANKTVEGSVVIDGNKAIAYTDEDFVCATLDWWPPESCNNGVCSWGRTSLLNLDLKNIVLMNAIKAFSPLRIRLGGTLQDRVIYQTEDNRSSSCPPFSLNSSQLFGFTEGCLPLSRWDELNSFFNQSRAVITFGLNALNGRTVQSNNTATGPWDSTNAKSLIQYTVKKGYNVYGWEIGNELGGRPIGIGVAAVPYASDTRAFHGLVKRIYRRMNGKPQIMAPGGIFESTWFKQFLHKSVGSVNVITHHIYNIGIGNQDEKVLIQRILDPSVLDNVTQVYRDLKILLQNSTSRASAWVGEAGGIAGSGRDGVSNTFLFSFWYLDQLGMASTYGTKVYCRQTLVGGNYGLLNTTTFVPNPDYYSALLWHRLMGKTVLSTKFSGTRSIRAYAHCAKKSKGITVLLINLDGNATVHAKLEFIGTSAEILGTEREEYRLTAMHGNIQSRTVLLNGKALTVDSSGDIPILKPLVTNSSNPITVAPYSIAFVHMPNIAIPACMGN